VATLRSSQALSRATPPPTAAWLQPPDADGRGGIIAIPDGRGRSSIYDLVEIECSFEGCRGFSLVKHDPFRPQYHVLLSMTNPQDESCDCMGFSRWSRCKHLAAVRRLLLGGQP
jgi:hypothetical protein